MSDRRQVWYTLSELLARLDRAVSAARTDQAGLPADTGDLNQEVRKLGRAQFKTNLLVEEQARHSERTLAAVEATQAQHAQLLETLSTEQTAAARFKILQAIIPALDGLENAIASGQSYLNRHDPAPDAGSISAAQQGLGSPADRQVLAAWLDGLRLVRERLLAVLAAGGATPIPTVGHPFDPYLHVAVGTTAEGDGAPGIIVAEERAGYRSPAGVLRYADVIVYRQEEGKT